MSAGVYDPVRDRVLASSNGIWELGMAPGSSWRQVPVAGPAPGGGLPWLYDPIHDRVVTVDEHGRTAPLSVSTLSLGDTLRWSGPNPLTAIPLRAGTALAIDTRRDRLLVFGGASTSQLLAQVWSVDLEDWHCEQLAIADTFFMTARSGASAAYDPLRDRLIVCGGHVNGVSTSQFLGMLELSGSPTWVAPALREADFDLARPNDGLWPSPRDRAFTYFDPVRDRLIVNGGSYLEIDYSQDVANGFTLDWGNARAPQIGCASLPAQVSGTARAAWAVSNPMPLAADLEWNVTSSRAWPGLPATGTLSLPALSADSIVVTYTVPDTAAPGPVDLTLVTSLVGAPMLADTCVAAGINAVDVAGPPARVFELRLAGGQPVRGALGVELAVPAAGAVTVDVFDVAGRRVASTRTNGAAGGRARLDAAPGRRLPPGLYAVRARWAGEERVIRAVVVH